MCLLGIWLEVFSTNIDLKVFNAPFQGFFMSGEEHVEPVSFDGAASVEDFHGLAVAVTGNEHFSAEGVSAVRRYKGIARLYLVPAGRNPIGIFAAAFFAGAVCGHSHLYGVPLFAVIHDRFRTRNGQACGRAQSAEHRSENQRHICGS